ncbi:MAG: hypothetical protein ABJN62_06975 [Halioglobus sp.]
MNKCLPIMILLLLTACGKALELPAAQSLKVAPEVINELHGATKGPFSVVTNKTLEIETEDGATLALSLYYPGEELQHPLLLFSHGNWSDRHSYDRIIEHWVSHGYVVIATDHSDCCSPVKGIFNSLRYGQMGLINRRISELELLLANIDTLENQLPAFADKADTSKVAATGHSFGAFSAQQLGGASALDPETGEYRYQTDPRISAVVALNPPGPMFDTITADSWKGMTAPTLVTTGTWDVQKGFWEDWKLHLMSWEKSPDGKKYALVIDGADHYLGNLICRTERDHPPQDDALKMVQLTTTAFLDSQLKSNKQARMILADKYLERETKGYAKILRR